MKTIFNVLALSALMSTPMLGCDVEPGDEFDLSEQDMEDGEEDDVARETRISPTEVQPIRGKASSVHNTFAPRFIFSNGSCFPMAAVDADGRLNEGLGLTRSVSGGCAKGTGPGANTYVRSKTFSSGRTVHTYAVYFPKDGLSLPIVPDLGHRHDWERVYVWTKDDNVTHVTFGQHGGYYTFPEDKVQRNGKRIRAFVGKTKHGMYHNKHNGPGSVAEAACYFCDTRHSAGEGTLETPEIVSFDLMPNKARDEFTLASWGSANNPLREDRFDIVDQLHSEIDGGGFPCKDLGCLCSPSQGTCPTAP